MTDQVDFHELQQALKAAKAAHRTATAEFGAALDREARSIDEARKRVAAVAEPQQQRRLGLVATLAVAALGFFGTGMAKADPNLCEAAAALPVEALHDASTAAIASLDPAHWMDHYVVRRIQYTDVIPTAQSGDADEAHATCRAIAHVWFEIMDDWRRRHPNTPDARDLSLHHRRAQVTYQVDRNFHGVTAKAKVLRSVALD